MVGMSENEKVKIPDAAVEAAARAMAPAAWGPSVWQFRAHGETSHEARDRVQQESLRDARAALEAAAPHMLALGPHPTMSDYPTPAKNAHIATCPQCQETFG